MTWHVAYFSFNIYARPPLVNSFLCVCERIPPVAYQLSDPLSSHTPIKQGERAGAYGLPFSWAFIFRIQTKKKRKKKLTRRHIQNSAHQNKMHTHTQHNDKLNTHTHTHTECTHQTHKHLCLYEKKNGKKIFLVSTLHTYAHIHTSLFLLLGFFVVLL